MDREEMIAFLIKLGVDAKLVDLDKNGFSRIIEFTVYDTTYRIVWFTNESTLRIGSGDRAAQIPFKYMYFDTTYPLIKANRSIGFSYVKNKKESFLDREYPYESFRIPLDISSADNLNPL